MHLLKLKPSITCILLILFLSLTYVGTVNGQIGSDILKVENQSDLDNLEISDTINKSIYFIGIDDDLDYSRLADIKVINGSLEFYDSERLTKLDFFSNLEHVEGRFHITDCPLLTQIAFPILLVVEEIILINLEGEIEVHLPELSSVRSNLTLHGFKSKSNLENLFPKLTHIGGALSIGKCDMTATGFMQLKSLRHLYLTDNDSLTLIGLDGPFDSLSIGISQNKFLELDGLEEELTYIDDFRITYNESLYLKNPFHAKTIKGSIKVSENSFYTPFIIKADKAGNLSITNNTLIDSTLVDISRNGKVEFRNNAGGDKVFIICPDNCGSIFIQNNSSFNDIYISARFDSTSYLGISENEDLERVAIDHETSGKLQEIKLSKNRNLQEIIADCKISHTNSIEVQDNDNLSKIHGFNELIEVGTGLRVADNKSLKSLLSFDKLTKVGGSLDILRNPRLSEISEFIALRSSSSIWFQQNNSLAELRGFENLDSVNSLSLAFNNSLTIIEGINPKHLNEAFIGENPKLTKIDAFHNLKYVRNFRIFSNPELHTVLGFDQMDSTLSFSITENSLLKELPQFSSVRTAKRLEIDNITVAELDIFNSLENIDALDVSGDGIVNLSIGEDLISGSISIVGSKIKHITGMENLEESKHITLRGESITLIPTFKSLRHIDMITLADLGLETLDHFNTIDSLGSVYIFNSNFLRTIDGFKNLKKATGTVNIYDHPNLEKITAFENLIESRLLYIRNNDALEDISGFSKLEQVTSNLFITDNKSLSDCCFIKKVLSSPTKPSSVIIKDNATNCNSPDIASISCSTSRAYTFEEITKTDSNGEAYIRDSTVITEGIVQNDRIILKEKDLYFLSDSTGASTVLDLYQYNKSRMVIRTGDRIKVEAKVLQENGQITLFPYGVIKESSSNHTTPVADVEVLSDQNESSLVKIENVRFITQQPDSSIYKNLWATNTADTFQIATATLNGMEAIDSEMRYDITGFVVQNDMDKPFVDHYIIIPQNNEGVLPSEFTTSTYSEVVQPFKMGPNPCKDYLTISGDRNIRLFSIDIMDNTGKTVASGNSTLNQAIDVRHLVSGIYFVRFNSSAGIHIEKLIKH